MGTGLGVMGMGAASMGTRSSEFGIGMSSEEVGTRTGLKTDGKLVSQDGFKFDMFSTELIAILVTGTTSGVSSLLDNSSIGSHVSPGCSIAEL